MKSRKLKLLFRALLFLSLWLCKTPSGEEDFSLAYLLVSIPVTQNCVLTVPFSWGAIPVISCSFYLWYSNILFFFFGNRVISLWEENSFLLLEEYILSSIFYYAPLTTSLKPFLDQIQQSWVYSLSYVL